MPDVTMNQVRKIAQLYGHTDLLVTETRRHRWISTCSCGFSSGSLLNQAQAAQAVTDHVVEVARQHMANARAAV
jgi:hypothetical protein